MNDIRVEFDDNELRQRLAEGIRQLQNGEGVERPEWTRFVDEPTTLDGHVGNAALAATKED